MTWREFLGTADDTLGRMMYASTIPAFARALRRGYMAAVAILALITVSSYLLLRQQLTLQNEAVEARTLITEQIRDLNRTRSIVALALYSPDVQAQTTHVSVKATAEMYELTSALRLRQAKLKAVIEGQGTDPSAAAAAPTDLNRGVERIAQALDKLGASQGDQIAWRFSVWAPMMLELADGGSLMSAFNQELRVQDVRVERLTARSQRVNLGLASISLTVLLLEVLLIFSPLLRRLLKLGSQLNEATAELRHAAFHDALTGVGNRKLLQEVARFRPEAHGAAKPCALMILDIDDFKSINDTYGHPVGDEVLRLVAARLTDVVAGRGQAFRSGGDEFVILWQHPCDASSAGGVADRLVSQVSLPMPLTGVANSRIHCTASIGVALVEDSNQPMALAELLRAADLALREAKKPNNANVVVYGQGSTLRMGELLSLGSRFGAALEQGHVKPYYQPIIDLDSGEVVALEALARWIEPDGTIRLPSQFMELAEQSRRSGDLAEVILRQVARDRERFMAHGLRQGRVGVNLAESNLVDDQLAARVVWWTGSNDLSWLTIEVLETVLLHRSWRNISANLTRLAGAGAAIALDDFGSGYASLQHLTTLECKSIKIDRLFVARLPSDASACTVVNGMVEMALALKLGVVVEGIETAEQADYFRSRWRGLRGQGFGIKMPQSAQAIVEELSNATQMEDGNPWKLHVKSIACEV